MITREQIDILTNGKGNIHDPNGDKIGSIGTFYLDDGTGTPSWVTVKTGLFGSNESFVPLQGARPDGDDLHVSYAKDQIKDAPNVAPDGHLTPDEEDRLYTYYSLGRPYGTDAGYAAGGYTGDRAETGTPRGEDARGTVGRDTSGPTTDDAMTRSEEQLNVGTERREAGRARLRKYVVTENVTQTVPVTREEVRIEREPITDANRGAALSGPDISEEEHEVTLHEERPVIEKETVPVERVRLEKDTVTDQETVSEEVRKERIETEGDTGRTGR